MLVQQHPAHQPANVAAGCPLARVQCGLVDATSASAPSACPAVVRAADVDVHRRTCPFRTVRHSNTFAFVRHRAHPRCSCQRYTCAQERCQRCGVRIVARRTAAHDATCCVRPCPRHCGAAVPVRELSAHAARDCPHTLVQCGIPDVYPDASPLAAAAPSLRCPFVCRRHELVAHAAECAFRPVACAECGTLCSQRRLVAHAAACPAVNVRCPAGCGEVLLRGALPRHAATVCPSRAVACDWHPFGASCILFPPHILLLPRTTTRQRLTQPHCDARRV
jgi:hypothetical protein